MSQLSLVPPAGQQQGDITVSRLSGYLFQLTEQLRYVLNNLGEENLDDDTRGVLLGMRDVRDNLEKKVSRDDLSTAIRQTERSIALTVEAMDGRIAQMEQTADGITSRVENAEGGLSRVTQTAEGLRALMSALDGRVTRVETGMDGLTVTSRMENDVSSAVLTGAALAFSGNGQEKGRLTMDENGLTLSGQDALRLTAPRGVTVNARDILSAAAPPEARPLDAAPLLEALRPVTYTDSGRARFGFAGENVAQALENAGLDAALLDDSGRISLLELIAVLTEGWQRHEARIKELERSAQ